MDLHFAVRNKVLAEIRFLVESGTDPNIRDEELLTPLMLCCLENDEVWSVGVARMLLQTGAKVECVDKSGRNALMLCSLFKRRQLAALLLKAIDFDLDTSDYAGNTALHYAVLGGDSYIVKELVYALKRQQLSHRSINKQGHTAMSLAKQMKKVEIVELFRSPELECARYEKDFVVQIPKKLLRRPWDDEMHLIQHPNLLRKSLTREIIEGAQTHRARSLNIPGIRPSRHTNKGVAKKNAKVKRNKANQTKPDAGFECEIEGNSWRTFLPEYLTILKEQQSASYRHCAKTVSQSYDEIFNFVTMEDKVSSESEDSSTDKNLAPINPGVGARRKSTIRYPPADSQGVSRSRSNSDVYEAFALQPDGKRRNRRQSMQLLSNHALLERRKTLARLSNERLPTVAENAKVAQGKPRKIPA